MREGLEVALHRRLPCSVSFTRGQERSVHFAIVGLPEVRPAFAAFYCLPVSLVNFLVSLSAAMSYARLGPTSSGNALYTFDRSGHTRKCSVYIHARIKMVSKHCSSAARAPYTGLRHAGNEQQDLGLVLNCSATQAGPLGGGGRRAGGLCRQPGGAAAGLPQHRAGRPCRGAPGGTWARAQRGAPHGRHGLNRCRSRALAARQSAAARARPPQGGPGERFC